MTPVVDVHLVSAILAVTPTGWADARPRLTSTGATATASLMGSDWPVGEADPIGFVERCPGLSDDDRVAILGGTARRLLELT